MTVHAASFEKLFEELASVDYVSIDACNLEKQEKPQNRGGKRWTTKTIL